MATEPLEQLREVPVEAKRENESLREYVLRLGEEADLEEDLVEAAADFVTEWYFSSGVPEDEAAFEAFLAALREAKAETGADADPDAPGDVPAEPDRSPAEGPPGPDGVTPTAARADAPREVEGADPVGGPIERHRSVRTGEGPIGFKGGLRGAAARRLLLRFAAVVVTTPVIGWMLGRAWVPGHRLYDGAQRALVGLTGLAPEAALEVAGMVGLGLYLGLLVGFVADVKKRVQGMLLLIGTGLALGVLSGMGVFLPNIEYGAARTAVSLLAGIGLGLLVEADRFAAVDRAASTFRRPVTTDGRLPEFRRAARTLYALVAVVVLGGLAQAFLAGVVTIYDPVAAGVFLLTFLQFVRYESEASYVTLGPARAGKSMLLVGLVLTLLEDAVTDPTPNEYLRQSLERVSNLQAGAARWPIPSTPPEELREASFEVIAGTYFPRRLELTALDYAGQHLGRVAELLGAGGPPESPGTVPERVAARIASAGTLLFVLDVERFVFPEAFDDDIAAGENVSWGFEHYSTILEHTDPDDVIVLATKCDILIERGHVDPPFAYEGFADFRAAVTAHLADRPDVEELLSRTGAEAVHPVYVVTTRTEGEYRPRLDDAGRLVPVGHDFLLEALKRRQ